MVEFFNFWIQFPFGDTSNNFEWFSSEESFQDVLMFQVKVYSDVVRMNCQTIRFSLRVCVIFVANPTLQGTIAYFTMGISENHSKSAGWDGICDRSQEGNSGLGIKFHLARLH